MIRNIVCFNHKRDICFRDSRGFLFKISRLLTVGHWVDVAFYKLKLKSLYSVLLGTMHSDYWLSILFLFFFFFRPLFNYFDKAIEILHIPFKSLLRNYCGFEVCKFSMNTDAKGDSIFRFLFVGGKHHKKTYAFVDDRWRACGEILLKVSTATAMDS